MENEGCRKCKYIPLCYGGCVEYLNSGYSKCIKPVIIYCGVLLAGVIVQYFGELAFARYKLNLYNKFKGIIFEDFVNISDRKTILGNIGYYSQDIYIFNDTIINNVTNGNADNDAEINKLISKFGLDKLNNRPLRENGINISFTQSKTLLIVSHDFDVLERTAKKYILMDKNRIIEVGTHEQLYDLRQTYRNLFDTSRKSKERDNPKHKP
jgi:ABC-type multidrug transport system fused ATPase/permease subunit